MKNKTSQSICAQEIRTELKTKFPTTKFKVTSEGFAGGNSVNIKWENGPTEEQVNEIVGKYQYGHFNGMEDIYEYSNSRKDITQVKYISTSRDFTDEVRLKVCLLAKEDYEALEEVEAPTLETLGNSINYVFDCLNWYGLSYRILNKLDLTNMSDIIIDPDFECGSLFEGFKVLRGGQEE